MYNNAVRWLRHKLRRLRIDFGEIEYMIAKIFCVWQGRKGFYVQGEWKHGR